MPAAGTTFVAPASTTLTATATDVDGTINSVAFYANGALIGTDTTSPYSIAWSNLPAGSYTLTAVATDNLNATTTSAAVAVTVTATPATRVNWALAANGASTVASSTNSPGHAASNAINGDRKGVNWGAGGGWNDGTPDVFPDWLEVDFAGTKTIDEVDVFSMQDSYPAPGDPTPTMTFNWYGLRDFDVQYWTGSVWEPVPGGTIKGNTLVWRKLVFAAVTTSRIRVYVTNAMTWSRITEVEAYGPK
jgi:hypothetical protein